MAEGEMRAELVARRVIWEGNVGSFGLDEVVLPSGERATLALFKHPGASAVVPFLDAERVVLLRQFRHAAQGWVWELPAGKIDNREPPLETARRELEEEAGMRAAQWRSLGESLSSPGVFTEVVHLFLATGLHATEHRPEEHEVFEVHWLPLAQALEMASAGEIRDAKSVIGLFRASSLLARP